MKKNKNKILSILMFVCCSIIGGIIGFMGALGSLPSISDFNSIFVYVPVIIAFICILITVYCLAIRIYASKKIKKENYNDDENSAFDKLETKLSFCMILSALISPLTFTSLGIMILYQNHYSTVIFSTISTASCCFITIYNDAKIIKLVGKVQPDKNHALLDITYQKKLLDSMDELEKKIMGEASASVISLMPIIFVPLLLVGILFSFRPEYYLGISIIWMTMLLLYFYHLHKCDKKYNKK